MDIGKPKRIIEVEPGEVEAPAPHTPAEPARRRVPEEDEHLQEEKKRRVPQEEHARRERLSC